MASSEGRRPTAPVLESLQASGVATAIGQSQFWLASLSALHLIGFTLVMGAAVVTNLYLAGLLFRDRSSHEIVRPAARLLLAGLGVSLVTGALMFLPRAASAAANPTFRMKMSLLAAASVLALVVQPRVTAGATAPGASARILGGAGLVLWLGVALAACAFILLE